MRVTKLKFIDDAKMSLASHLLQRHLVWKFVQEKDKGTKLSFLKDIRFHSGKFGRPYFRSSPESDYVIDFNISTVSGRVIIAHIVRSKNCSERLEKSIQAQTDCPVLGIDLTDPPSLQSAEWMDEFAPMVSTPDELLAIKAASSINIGISDIDRTLLSGISLAIRWAIKESYIKGIGAGLVGAVDISQVEVDKESNDSIDKLVIDEYLKQARSAASHKNGGDNFSVSKSNNITAKYFSAQKVIVASSEQADWRVKIFTFDGIIAAIMLHQDICVSEEPELNLNRLALQTILDDIATSC
ncbi:alpha-aminoadipate reductase phosphopantetheinyl transferase Lys7 [Sugiyamaella lignohabitans]|uniref:holo-[acyl-carrier-protein] synthase n=1 Tax=Sugiyamaella lignohabitans TaxID=796027 RepID=A0A161HJV8_9ASCO|nr:alpha-aminoadipate reductase phosphopantetheinyl transferase Lys7 [Sugiyamaella lignohabitans]ANB11788.1 alpha-aminoadipate reductase phosphopantetheinyl transferase Lys7 [Sugiyamaella lignohabitans]